MFRKVPFFIFALNQRKMFKNCQHSRENHSVFSYLTVKGTFPRAKEPYIELDTFLRSKANGCSRCKKAQTDLCRSSDVTVLKVFKCSVEKKR